MNAPAAMRGPSARVALYLRRSTEEHQETSLETQQTEAMRYCDTKGWNVAEEHIFIDDGVSRAEFKKRPGLIRLLNGAKRGDFDVLVIRDETRLGGDLNRTGMVMQDLEDARVQLVYYYTNELVQLDSAVNKFLVMARNFAAELEREKTSQRTHEGLLVRARQGKPAGGIAFGYQIVRDGSGQPEYTVHPKQAPAVVRIFERYAAGDGQRTIARDLNEDGIPSPRAGRRGTGSWAPSTVRAILTNPRYRGEGRYNQTQKSYRGGTKVRDKRVLGEHVKYETARIVTDDLWGAVAARFDANRGFGKKQKGEGGAPARYLLSGIGRCAECGGPIQVANAKRNQTNIKVYICAWHKDRGNSVCKNTTRQPMAEVDAAVLDFLREDILVEEVLAEVVGLVRQRLELRSQQIPGELDGLKREAAKLEAGISNLTDALAEGSAEPTAVLNAIGDREKKLTDLRAKIATRETAPDVIHLEVRRLERDARSRLDALRGLAAGNLTEARGFVKCIIDGRIDFAPVEVEGKKRYRLTAALQVEGLLLDVGGSRNPGESQENSEVPFCVVSPAGFATKGTVLQLPGGRAQEGGWRLLDLTA